MYVGVKKLGFCDMVLLLRGMGLGLGYSRGVVRRERFTYIGR